MYILGISAYYHDSAACLLKDGKIVAACQEERFTRKKHDASFPSQAITACLEIGGITKSDIDLVAFYDKPFLKLNCTYYFLFHYGLIQANSEIHVSPFLFLHPYADMVLFEKEDYS